MYKQDLVLNNPQGLIGHKPNQIIYSALSSLAQTQKCGAPSEN